MSIGCDQYAQESICTSIVFSYMPKKLIRPLSIKPLLFDIVWDREWVEFIYSFDPLNF